MTVGNVAKSRRFSYPLLFIIGGVAGVHGHAADPVKAFPQRPVRLVSPFAAGGNTDIIGRLLAPAGSVFHLAAELFNTLARTDLRPGYDVTSFACLAATGGTPRAVVARLNRDLHAVLALTEINKHLVDTGGDVRPGTPEEMGRHVAADMAKWKRVVAEKKIELQ